MSLPHPFTRRLYRYAFWLLPLLAGCTEFLEEPIDDQHVALLSPGQNAALDIYALDFRWERIDFAIDYRLQIATPNFDSAVYFLADTIVSYPGFTTTVAPGRYEWRVMARNGSSHTPYTTHRLTIYDGDLAKQKLLLKHPADGYTTSAAEVALGWLPLHGATSYTLEIDDRHFADEAAVLFRQELSQQTFTYRPEAEGTFQWRVRAQNAEAQTAWSAIRQFTRDRTPPEAPELEAPANGATAAAPVRLQWSGPADASAYQLYLYKADSVTLYAPDFPKRLEAGEYVLERGNRGEKIVWRVRALDAAGNSSSFSAYRSFRIQP